MISIRPIARRVGCLRAFARRSSFAAKFGFTGLFAKSPVADASSRISTPVRSKSLAFSRTPPPRAPLLDDLDAHAADRMSAAVTAADRATSGKHCAQCGTWLPRDEYSKTSGKSRGIGHAPPAWRMGCALNGKWIGCWPRPTTTETRGRRRGARRGGSSGPRPRRGGAAPAPAPGPAPRPPGLERRGVTAAPSSLTEATTPSTHSTAPAPCVDPAAATFAIGRAADEGPERQAAAQDTLRQIQRESNRRRGHRRCPGAPTPSSASSTGAARRGHRAEQEGRQGACGGARAPGPRAAAARGGANITRGIYDRTRAPGRRGAADLKGARAPASWAEPPTRPSNPVAAAAAPPPWQRAPGPQVGPPGFL